MKQNAQLRMVQQDRRNDQADRRREQASHVNAWIAAIHAPGPIYPNWRVEVVVRNGSNDPVYNCRIYVQLGSTPDDQPFGVMRPGYEETRTAFFNPFHPDNADARMFLEFLDSARTTWHRLDTGELREGPGPARFFEAPPGPERPRFGFFQRPE